MNSLREQPLVTVVVPCYNQADFLAEALPSVQAQTHARVECIVVDDGSEDERIGERALEYGARCLKDVNRGLPRARNRGLAECRGEFVLFLDADDRLLPDAIAIGVEESLRRPHCAFVSGDHRYIDRDGSILREWQRPPIEADHYAQLLRNNYIGMCATVLYRTSVVRAFGGFDGRYAACADYDLQLRIASRLPVYSHHRLVAEYRRYEGSMSDDPVRMLRAAIGVLRRHRRQAGGDRWLWDCYREGLRHWRSYYGPAALEFAQKHRRTPGLRLTGWRETFAIVRHAPTVLLGQPG